MAKGAATTPSRVSSSCRDSIQKSFYVSSACLAAWHFLALLPSDGEGEGGGETWSQEEGNDSSVQCLAALPPIPARARKGEIERAGNFL